jgi:hypothetical protein
MTEFRSGVPFAGFLLMKRMHDGDRAVVWLAAKGEREYVLKVAKTPEDNEHVAREARMLGHVGSDPSTVTIAEPIRHEGGLAVLVLERLHGQSLAELIVDSRNGLAVDKVHALLIAVQGFFDRLVEKGHPSQRLQAVERVRRQ